MTWWSDLGVVGRPQKLKIGIIVDQVILMVSDQPTRPRRAAKCRRAFRSNRRVVGGQRHSSPPSRRGTPGESPPDARRDPAEDHLSDPVDQPHPARRVHLAEVVQKRRDQQILVNHSPVPQKKVNAAQVRLIMRREVAKRRRLSTGERHRQNLIQVTRSPR
jgi:hypothetical protein